MTAQGDGSRPADAGRLSYFRRFLIKMKECLVSKAISTEQINKIAQIIHDGGTIPQEVWDSLSDVDKAAIEAEVERLNNIIKPK